jgi:hypothetical protein
MAIGPQDKKSISAVSLLDQREILSAVSDIQNDEGLIDICMVADRYKVAKMGTYHSYVNEPLYKLGDTTGATVTGSGTATVGTTLTEATSGFARKGDLVKFPNGKVGLVTNVVTASSQDTLTIKSVDGTNLTHTAGQKLSAFSSAFGEKSLAPANRTTGFTKFYNNLQIFREVNEITDVQNASYVEVSYKGQNKIIYKDLVEKAIKFKGDINGAIFGGVRSSTLWSDASPALTDAIGGGAVQTTGGLDWYITSQGGISDSVASAGTVTLADFEELFGLLVAAKAPKKYMAMVPSKAMAKVDNCLKGLNSSGATSGQLSLDGKNLDFNVQSLDYMNFSVEFVPCPILDHQEMFSQTDIVKSAYFIPKDQVRVHGEGGTQPRFQMRYFKNDVKGGSDIIGEWHEGALSPDGPTNGEAIWRTHMRTIQGLEALGVQHMAKYGILA